MGCLSMVGHIKQHDPDMYGVQNEFYCRWCKEFYDRKHLNDKYNNITVCNSCVKANDLKRLKDDQ